MRLDDKAGAAAFRPLTGGAVSAASGQIVTAATGALTTLVLARILGPSGAGVIAISLSLSLGLLTIATLGLQNGLAYLVSTDRWSARAAFVQTQLVALAGGLVCIGLGLAVRAAAPAAFEGLSIDRTLITLAAVPFALSWTYASSLGLAVDQYGLFAAPPAGQSCLALLISPVLAALEGPTGAIVGLVASQAITAVVTFIWAMHVLPAPDGLAADRLAGHPLRSALSFGLMSHLANVLSFVNYRLDLFILNAVTGPREVGQYSIAVSVMSAIWLLPRALSSVLMPRVARVTARREAMAEDYRDLVETKSIRHASLTVAVSGVLLSAALILLVLFFFGPDFRPSIPLGLILLPGTALLGVSGVLAAIILGRGHPLYSLLGTLIITPPTIGLYLILVPPLGAEGAALASTLSYSAGFAVGAWFYRRATGSRVIRLLLPTRSELDDYRRLLAGLRARTRDGGPRRTSEDVG